MSTKPIGSGVGEGPLAPLLASSVIAMQHEAIKTTAPKLKRDGEHAI